tara:strand:+ start:61 stop:471 length:411 start_codon:yes stop_codon:yes gene_type:complete
MAKDQFGFGVEKPDVIWGEKRKQSDYEGNKGQHVSTPWEYDSRINQKSKEPTKEADEYLRKNIPYIARGLDNTIELTNMINQTLKTGGLKGWKEVIDSFIVQHNPMNIYNEKGDGVTKFGTGDFWEHWNDSPYGYQ